MVELANGCICCSINNDLVDATFRVLQREPAVDRLIVETTGIADPLPVLLTFLRSEFRDAVRIDSVVALADAENFSLDLVDSKAALNQLRYADFVVLNKCDLVGSGRGRRGRTKDPRSRRGNGADRPCGSCRGGVAADPRNRGDRMLTRGSTTTATTAATTISPPTHSKPSRLQPKGRSAQSVSRRFSKTCRQMCSGQRASWPSIAATDGTCFTLSAGVSPSTRRRLA